MSLADAIDEGAINSTISTNRMIDSIRDQRRNAAKMRLVIEAAKVRRLLESKLYRESKHLSPEEKDLIKNKAKEINRLLIGGMSNLETGELNAQIQSAKKLI